MRQLDDRTADEAACTAYLRTLAGDNSLFRRRFREAFFRAMRQQLTARQFGALWAQAVEGKSGAEIARMWHISPSAVSRHLSRGKKRLQVLLSYNLQFQQNESG